MVFEPDDYLAAVKEYKKLKDDDRDPKKVGLAEGIG